MTEPLDLKAIRGRLEVIVNYKWGSENSPGPELCGVAHIGLDLLSAVEALAEAGEQLVARTVWPEGPGTPRAEIGHIGRPFMDEFIAALRQVSR